MPETLSTRERIYIPKRERDFEGYEKELQSEKAKLEAELAKKEAKLEGTDDDNEKAISRLEVAIAQLEAQVKAVEDKIDSIPALKEFVEQYGPSKFTIKSQGRRRNAVLMTEFGIGDKNTKAGKMIEYMFKTVEENLTGWDNYRSKSAGEIIPFNMDELDIMPDDLFNELYNQIAGRVDEVTAKN